MKNSAAVMVLAGESLAAREIEPCVSKAGHRVVAIVRSVDEALCVLDGAPAAGIRPDDIPAGDVSVDVVLVDIAIARAASADTVAALARRLAAPLVYVAGRADELEAQDDRAPERAGRPGGPRREDIACLLQPRELSLAIRLALCSPRQAHPAAERDQQVAGEITADGDGLVPSAFPIPERWMKLLMAMPIALYSSRTPNGYDLAFVSQNIHLLLGYQQDEIVGARRFWRDHLHPEDAPQVLASLAQQHTGDDVRMDEYRLRRRDGNYRWLLDIRQPVCGQDGEVVGMVGVWMDVTERRNAEEALRRGEERYESLFRRAAVPMWEADIERLLQALAELRDRGVSDFRAYFDEAPERIGMLISEIDLVDMNAEALELFGARSKEELQRRIQETLLPESISSARAILLGLIQGEKHCEYESALRSLQGDIRTVIFRVAFPVEKSQNMLLSSVDITERKRAEERIRQLNDDLKRRAAELQTANVELESFSYSVSHDLRAPLRAMDGFSTALLEDYTEVLDARATRYLHRIRQASQRMARLIDDLLALSRMSRSAMRLESCDLSAMAHSAVGELRKAHPEREVDVIIEPGLRVHADRTLLRVVVENLLGNAWKFTAKEPQARIELGSRQRDGQTVYFVRDNGAGFDMTYANKLFRAFQRLHPMEDFDGSGIGLATVKRIIQRHGGEVWAEGEVGAGATFTFTLF